MSIIEQALGKLDDDQQLASNEFIRSEISNAATNSTSRLNLIFGIYAVGLILLTIGAFFLLIKGDETTPNTTPMPISNIDEIDLISVISPLDELVPEVDLISVISPLDASVPEVDLSSIISHNSSIQNTKDEYAWVSRGWQSFENSTPLKALSLWENGFNELSNDSGLYITNISQISKKSAHAKVANDKTSFFIRWPLKKGNHLITLCLQPSNTIKNHCSNQLSKTKELVLKRDLSAAFYLSQLVSEKNHQITAPKKKINKKPLKKSPSSSIDNISSTIAQQLSTGMHQNTLNLLKRHRHQLVNSWEYYYWQSQAYVGLNQLSNAMKTIDIGIEKNKNKSVLWAQKGLLVQEKGNHHAAISLFKKAESLSNPPSTLFLNLGYSAAVIGDTQTAAHAYRQYLSMTEKDENRNNQIRQQVKDYLRQLL